MHAAEAGTVLTDPGDIGLFKKLRTEVKRYLKKLDELPHHVNLREEDVALIQAVA